MEYALGEEALGADAEALGALTTLSADAGAYVIAPVLINLFYFDNKVHAQPGAFALAGNDATLGRIMTILDATTGSLTIVGYAISMGRSYSGDLTDAVTFVDDPDNGTTTIFSIELAETIKFTPNTDAARAFILTETVEFSDETDDVIRLGAAWEDIVTFGDTPDPQTTYGVMLSDLYKLGEALAAGMPVSLSDQVVFDEALNVAVGAALLEQVIFTDQMEGNATFYLALVDTIRFSASLSNFLYGDLSDIVQFGETLLPVLRPNAELQDGVVFSEQLQPAVIFRLDMQDGVDFGDTLDLKAIYDAVLEETVEFGVGYVAPNGNFTTWAVNVSNNGVTEYTNYQFNSFAKMGLKYLGANSDGIYELDGARDDGEDIIATLKGGLLQFNDAQLCGFKAIYLGLRGQGDFFFKLETGDGREYVYAVKPSNASMVTTKINVGKGLRARYFSYELVSTGPEFALESVEFIPMAAKRRV